VGYLGLMIAFFATENWSLFVEAIKLGG